MRFTRLAADLGRTTRLAANLGRRAYSRRALSTMMAESEAGVGAHATVASNCQPIAMEALDRVLAARRRAGTVGSQFTIADFGSADGGASLPLMRNLVATVRAAEPQSAIVVVYEDQPSNDWASLFRLTEGAAIENAFVVASGTSFYNQCLPASTVDLGFSATAMHWLTELPAQIPDALHSACSTDPAALAAFDAQAARDWDRIMLMRAAELKPGGQMVVATFAKDEQGRFAGHNERRVSRSVHQTLSKIWHDVAGAEGHAATAFHSQYRSLEACARTFDAAKGGAAHAAGLQLLSAETAVVECPVRRPAEARIQHPRRLADAPAALGLCLSPGLCHQDTHTRLPLFLTHCCSVCPGAQFHTEWVEGTTVAAQRGDAAAHASAFVPAIRAWANATLVTGAVEGGVRPVEADDMADELFRRYEDLVAQSPSEHAMDHVHAYLHIGKAD